MLLVVALAVMLATTGCAMNESSSPSEPSNAAWAAETLEAIPPLEDAEVQVRSAIERVGAQARAIAPVLTWRWQDDSSGAGCSSPFDKTGGQLLLMPNYVSDVPIPDSSWGQILALAEDQAAKLGATKREVFKDEPGHHDVRFYNEAGTAIRIGSWKAALISGSTGCRLPRGDASS